MTVINQATRFDLLGVGVDSIDYEAACDRLLDAALGRYSCTATALAVHGLVTASRDERIGTAVANMDIVAPDGQPIRWALNSLHDTRLVEPVAGPTLTSRMLTLCAERGLGVYFYGSTEETLSRLRAVLPERYPGLKVVGTEASKFRLVEAPELRAIADRILSTSAQLVFVGLGCPRQELFVDAIRPFLPVPSIAVGAAFDFEAGQLVRAPSWMQAHGLEWLFRLRQEPQRLWRRYLSTNTRFICGVAGQRLGRRSRPRRLFRPTNSGIPA